MKFLSPFQNQAYALLRIATGFMFMFHGLKKVFGMLGGTPKEFFTQMWFGGVIELVGGILVMIGLRTRIASFICSGTMAVAYIQFHWKFSMGEGLLPIVNQGEMALLYAFVFLFLATKGGVTWCVDKKG